jgi:hypothetical protein
MGNLKRREELQDRLISWLSHGYSLGCPAYIIIKGNAPHDLIDVVYLVFD